MGKADKKILASSITLVKKVGVKASQEKLRKIKTALPTAKMTEEQVLADESIWQVSESDGDDDNTLYNRKDRNIDFHSSPTLMQEEEKQMARYMVERAPGSVRDTQDF